MTNIRENDSNNVGGAVTRLVLHVGAHKTGTSLLQKYMRDEEAAVLRNGISYISRGDMNDYVGWGKPLIKTPEKLIERVRVESARNPDNIIVASHENTLGKPLVDGKPHLYPESGPRIDALAKLGAEFDLSVIYYIRRQASFIESYYLQLVHQGNFEQFHDWFARFRIDELAWTPTLNRLRERVGHDRVTVVDFDEIKEGQNEFIHRFMNRVKAGYQAKIDYKPQRNRSIGDKGLRIALAANPHLQSDEERSRMRKFLQKHYSNADFPRPVLLADEDKAHLDDLYAAEFENL